MKLDILFHYEVDETTGEITYIGKEEIKVDTKVSTKKIQKDEDPEPKLYLEETKYRLTSAAIALMGVTTDDKLDIRYESTEDGSIPIIGTEKVFGTGGNKLTKSNTVLYKGIKNEELAKFGHEFTIIEHPNKSGVFILSSPDFNPEKLIGDENIQVDDSPFDLDLEGLLDETNEVKPSMFKF